MPVGLQVWDPVSRIRLDTNFAIGRIIGRFDTTATSGSIPFPYVDGGGKQFAYAMTTVNDPTYGSSSAAWVRDGAIYWVAARDFYGNYLPSQLLSITYGIC